MRETVKKMIISDMKKATVTSCILDGIVMAWAAVVLAQHRSEIDVVLLAAYLILGGTMDLVQRIKFYRKEKSRIESADIGAAETEVQENGDN